MVKHRSHLLNKMIWLGLPIACLVVLIAGGAGVGAATAASPVAGGDSGIVCTPWTQANDSAFALGTGAYSAYTGEEGFEVAVFNDQLYVGMEADSSFGARLWRTRANISVPFGQADWEEVIANAAGLPWGVANVTQVDHIDSLGVFRNMLYASSANARPAGGTLLYRSATGAPGSWAQAAPAGFGDANNINFKDLQLFDGRLCGGTQNWGTGAQVWCTADGDHWTQANMSGFGNRSRVEVWSGHVFRGALYYGVQDRGASSLTTNDDIAMLFRTTDLDGAPVWRPVFSGPLNSYRIDILGDLYGYLYISHRSADGIVILRSATGQADTWEQVNIPGMDGSAQQSITTVDGATVYGGALYVAVGDQGAGVTIWRTTGALDGAGPRVIWEEAGPPGITDPANIYAELITFNGHLYAWTSNYETGQQVLRTKCSRVAQAPAARAGEGQLTGRIWYDAADDGYDALPDQGIGGVWLDLTEAGTDEIFGTPDDVIYRGTEAVQDGAFAWSDLPAGRYRLDVREDTFPQHFAPLRPKDVRPQEFVLAEGERTHNELPYVLVAAAHLQGRLWDDLNANGSRESWEPGLAGIAIRLYYAGLDGIFGTADDFAKRVERTDAQGSYRFADLPAGRYRIAIAADQLPPDSVPTVQRLDPDQITLQEGQQLSGIDFGYAREATAAVEGVAWADADRNGLRSPNEPGVAGVKVDLMGAGPDGLFGTVEDAFFGPTFTDADGRYLFTGLVPGKYMTYVSPYSLPAGYALTTSLYSRPFVLAQGEHGTGIDFGLFHSFVRLAFAVATEPHDVVPGQPITYTVTLSNTGSVIASNYLVTSTPSVCPGGLDQEAAMPGWQCNWSSEQGCLFARCEMPGQPLAPGAVISYTQIVQTLPGMPADVESVQTLIAVTANGANQETEVITPILRPPATIEGAIAVQNPAGRSQAVESGIFITATRLDSGAQVTTFSDPAGRYWITGLAGGAYRLDLPRDTGPLECLSTIPVTFTLAYGQTLVQDFLYQASAAPVVEALQATMWSKGVHVAWQAVDESQVSAYRIWRAWQSTGPFRAASGPIAPSGSAGLAAYEWLDPGAINGRWYLLELLPSGRRVGPVRVEGVLEFKTFLPFVF